MIDMRKNITCSRKQSSGGSSSDDTLGSYEAAAPEVVIPIDEMGMECNAGILQFPPDIVVVDVGLTV